MTKHRITIELTRDEELAICDEMDRKARNLAINEFLLTAMEEAIPMKVQEAKIRKLQALKSEYEQLKAEVE